ncbi:cyclic nucleotide-binding protein [Cypionkella aquatica]|uniref:Cyclic nucleotide-binding protein n=1 Tax=Cypionkella aquatica TaxID=1756042 RepID=A0AA37U6B2_9RHOB|nr:cyclic nucleotide-binding protein [Cypionkella aquatica]
MAAWPIQQVQQWEGRDVLLNDEVKMLKQVPLFAGVSPAKLKLLAFTSERVSYRSGDVLCRQGDAGDAAFVLLSGHADVIVDGPTGQIKVADLEENAIVGEIAILCDVARTATVKAATAVEALRISKENFFKLMSDFPEMTIEVVRVLADRLSQTTVELSEARSRVAELSKR